STYKARYMFVGAHIESTESVRFEAVAIAYSNLDHWTQRSGLSRSLSSSEPIQIDIQYIHPPAVGVSLEGGTIVSLLSEFSTSGDLITSAGIQQRTLFRIE